MFFLIINFIHNQNKILTIKLNNEQITNGIKVFETINQNLKVQKKLQNFNYDRIYYNDTILNEEFDLDPDMIIDSTQTFFCTLIQADSNLNQGNQNVLNQMGDNQYNDNMTESFNNYLQNFEAPRSSMAEYSNNNFQLNVPNDEYLSIKNDIEECVKKDKQCSKVPDINTKACDLTKWRIRLIKVTGSLIMKNNDNNPSKIIKEKTARALIELYPILKNDKLSKGYEHIYDKEKNRGFLEWHIRNFRSNNQCIDKRSYKKRQKPEDSFEIDNESEIERTITLLKNVFVNTREDKDIVENGMKLTFKSRLNWIRKDQPTITRILEEYPKFKELPYLIQEDFKRNYGESNSKFIVNWPVTYMKKIVKYARESEDSEYVKIINSTISENPNDDELSLCALKILSMTAGYTSSKGRKGSRVSKLEIINYIYHEFKVGTGFEEISMAINNYTKQPVLVMFDNKQLYLKLDNDFIRLEKFTITNAIDILFKSFWVFNVEYPLEALNFYSFIEIIFGMNEKIQPCLLELDSILTNLN